mmetsp:Transcript_17015/g.64444  ORF Transcript_17015/g.64444 Transcript_17015/m.64444 type:complete len:293 (+) Transcript_17015:1202-2080(+)
MNLRDGLRHEDPGAALGRSVGALAAESRRHGNLPLQGRNDAAGNDANLRCVDRLGDGDAADVRQVRHGPDSLGGVEHIAVVVTGQRHLAGGLGRGAGSWASESCCRCRGLVGLVRVDNERRGFPKGRVRPCDTDQLLGVAPPAAVLLCRGLCCAGSAKPAEAKRRPFSPPRRALPRPCHLCLVKRDEAVDCVAEARRGGMPVSDKLKGSKPCGCQGEDPRAHSQLRVNHGVALQLPYRQPVGACGSALVGRERRWQLHEGDETLLLGALQGLGSVACGRSAVGKHGNHIERG